MAYNAQKIAPIDFKPSTAVGVSLPFNGEAVFNSNFTTQEAVKNNLINWFLTNKGERPLNPDFGGNLRRFIFEQISNDNLDLVEDDIQTQLKTYFPSVVVVNLNILAQYDDNAIIVELKYRVQNTNIEDQLTITFD